MNTNEPNTPDSSINNTATSRNVAFSHLLIVFTKGLAMGISDIIPGISGGTIAFITGIYQTLITALANILSITRLQELSRLEFKKIYYKINGNFLIPLTLGIAISILSLAHTIKYMLETYPVLIWSFFFALILSSALLIMKKAFVYTIPTTIAFSIGLIIALVITIILKPTLNPPSLPFIFSHGMIAITAMLLPGISGSYLLVIMGSYETILSALKTLNFPIIITFMLGCSVGVLVFSKVLQYILNRYYNSTIALLSGFMLGALPKAWPWKDAQATLLLPHEYASLYGSSNLLLSISLMLLAFLIIGGLEWLSHNRLV